MQCEIMSKGVLPVLVLDVERKLGVQQVLPCVVLPVKDAGTGYHFVLANSSPVLGDCLKNRPEGSEVETRAELHI